jgi:hypothetical protein
MNFGTYLAGGTALIFLGVLVIAGVVALIRDPVRVIGWSATALVLVVLFLLFAWAGSYPQYDP